MDTSLLRRLSAAHQAAHMVGWDFSRLEGRMEADRPSWDFDKMCVDAMEVAGTVLDVGTGGGERLVGLLETVSNRPPCVHATEGWDPNVVLARHTLEPEGIEVADYDTDEGGAMPFPTGYFDLVMACHEGYDAQELGRILRPGGLLLTQQVHGRDGEQLRDWFGGKAAYPHSTLEHYVTSAAAAGLRVESRGEWTGHMRFFDAQALVEYMGLVPWDVPEFTVEPNLPKLAELDASGPIVVEQRRYWLAARKESVNPRGAQPHELAMPISE